MKAANELQPEMENMLKACFRKENEEVIVGDWVFSCA